MDMHCILSIVEGGLNHYQQFGNGGNKSGNLSSSSISLDSSGSAVNCSDRNRISLELQDAELWQKFHEATNEMIVTKSGR